MLKAGSCKEGQCFRIVCDTGAAKQGWKDRGEIQRSGGVGDRQQASECVSKVKVGFIHILSLRHRRPSYPLWYGTNSLQAIERREVFIESRLAQQKPFLLGKQSDYNREKN